MRVKLLRDGPTHEDALQAKARELLHGLTEIAMFGDSEADRELARKAIAAARAAYRAGVYRAVD